MQPTKHADPTMTVSNFAIFISAHGTIPLSPRSVRNHAASPQSPGAGEGAAGNMPDAGSFPAPVHFSTM